MRISVIWASCVRSDNTRYSEWVTRYPRRNYIIHEIHNETEHTADDLVFLLAEHTTVEKFEFYVFALFPSSNHEWNCLDQRRATNEREARERRKLRKCRDSVFVVLVVLKRLARSRSIKIQLRFDQKPIFYGFHRGDPDLIDSFICFHEYEKNVLEEFYNS